MTFDYEARVQKALRFMVCEILKEVAQKGLLHPHHFYISFKTTYPGVVVPETLKRTYPEDITIVLQHQFWDLEITETSFSVVLAFQDIPKKITVPFNALLGFTDPSVRFSLHFTPPNTDHKASEQPSAASSASHPPQKEIKTSLEQKNRVISFEAFRKKKTK